MYRELNPVLMDPTRIFGELEREIVYYRDEKLCAVCSQPILWPDLEIHHVEEHQAGGMTVIENAVPVHRDCHPRGQNALEFRAQWLARKETRLRPVLRDDDAEDVVPVRPQPIGPRLPPEGTRCRFTYALRTYFGTVADGRIEIEEMSGSYGSFSSASAAVSQTARNGWNDWELLLPGEDDWLPANAWRQSFAQA